MDMVHVHVTDVSIIEVLLVVHTILRQSVQMVVVLTQFVLVVSTDVVRENVTDVMDVLHTLMVTT